MQKVSMLALLLCMSLHARKNSNAHERWIAQLTTNMNYYSPVCSIILVAVIFFRLLFTFVLFFDCAISKSFVVSVFLRKFFSRILFFWFMFFHFNSFRVFVFLQFVHLLLFSFFRVLEMTYASFNSILMWISFSVLIFNSLLSPFGEKKISIFIESLLFLPISHPKENAIKRRRQRWSGSQNKSFFVSHHQAF